MAVEKTMKFVSFHTHTTYSYGDGFGTVREHVLRVLGLGMSALAVSEHGNVNSHAALEQNCNDVGLKPIFGVEAYFGNTDAERRSKRKFHVGLFALNEEGYRNLNRIVTRSYSEAYQYPTVSWDNLKENSAGIAVLSGCADSLLSCTLAGGKTMGDQRNEVRDEDFKNTLRKIHLFQDIFEDRFFLEVQRFKDLPRTKILNPAYAELSRASGAPLFATADVHYPYPHQNKMQQTLHAGRRSSSVAVIEQEWEYDILLTYPESDEEIINDLIGTGLSTEQAATAVENTAKLAERCSVELPKAKPLRAQIAEHESDPAKVLKNEINKGWKKRVSQRPDLTGRSREYKERLKLELSVIVPKDFCDYFLVVADLVQWAKLNDVTVGPGRGSAAGSLVCYLLGITEIDPLHPTFSRMVFERFIDPTRSDMPDIDLDFDDSLRYKIPERAREVYGKENVANVANHIKYRGKKALQDVARAYGLPAGAFSPIGERCAIRVETDDRVDDSILDVLESYQSDDAISSLVAQHEFKIRQAIELEGNQHSMGVHAGGFVISSESITDICPIYQKKTADGKSRTAVIPYEKRDAEHLGMLKMDFLGLTTMGMIGLCRKWTNTDLDTLYSLYYKECDSKLNNEIMQKFRDDDVMGIFQYEGGTTREVVRQVQPDTFDELAACGALSRPGPYYGGQFKDYVRVKNGEIDWERIHPEGFDRHVSWTFGQIVYQEQIMWILRDLAGFSTERVLRVRKIIGKKLGEFQFAELWAEFRDGCANNSVSEQSALKVWGGITTAAGYAFNTSHAYSYALIAWWSMYYKMSSESVFFAASLAKNGDGKDDLKRRVALLQDARSHGVSVLPISPSNSDVTWRPALNPQYIMPGFSQINKIGEKTAQDIVAWRDIIEGQDSDPWKLIEWEHLLAVKGVGATTVAAMKSFADKDDPFGIDKTKFQLTEFRNQCLRGEFDPYGLPHSSEFVLSEGIEGPHNGVAFVGLVANIVFRDEIETVRARTGKSIEDIRAGLDRPDLTKKCTIFAYDEFGEVALRISRYRYGQLQDRVKGIKNDYHIIVGYGKTFENPGNSIQLNQLWVLDPDEE